MYSLRIIFTVLNRAFPCALHTSVYILAPRCAHSHWYLYGSAFSKPSCCGLHPQGSYWQGSLLRRYGLYNWRSPFHGCALYYHREYEPLQFIYDSGTNLSRPHVSFPLHCERTEAEA